MAPSPEYDKEPKAPDKSASNISSEDSKLLHNLVNDQHHNSDHKTTSTATNSEVESNKHVETLDDDKLRALLNEALTYKCPKDREGKSSLFKELLEEVEQDDQEACEAAARTLTGCRGSRRGARGGGSRPSLPHSNSLQDLVAALAAEPTPRRHHRHHAPPSPATVAARAIHGGSLPSGVDTSSMLSEEGSRGGAGYLATVRCVNPPPLAERRVSASDANAPHELELLNRRSKPMFPMTYTARATLEIGSGSVCSGRAVTTTTASNQVDSAIPFSCITTPEVVASCNTTASASHAPLAADPKPLGEVPRAASLTPAPAPPPAIPTTDAGDEEGRSVISSSLNGLPLSRQSYGATSTTSGDDYKVPTHTIVPLLPSFVKSLDENGNSVHGYGSPLSGSSQLKKPRRKKSSKNETVIDCRQIDGYQGDKDVNELLRFIESDRAPKLRKHKDDADDKGKKRSAERRKHHESKPARASSLEELSRTTLEELTARAPPAKPERRSWGDATPPPPPPSASVPVAAPVEQTDFQTVTKKRKPRRRTEEAAPRRARAPSPRPPASAPPSERSNDSNDDMESVHSLPERAPPHPHAAALHHHPPAPHASYADIARTRHNIPDLIESCNFYAEGEGGGPPPRAPDPPPDADNYPALDARVESSPPTVMSARRTPRDKPAQAPARLKERPSGPVPPPAPVDCPAPDVVADRRPPVILLDSASRPRDMDGVTFGFDINEQLLGDGARRPRCDLVRDAVEATPASSAPQPSSTLPVCAAKRALRYVPPPPPRDHSQLNQIVDFVGGAWEDVLRSGGGKVRYFSE